MNISGVEVTWLRDQPQVENEAEYAFKMAGRFFLDCWLDMDISIRMATHKRKSKF